MAQLIFFLTSELDPVMNEPFTDPEKTSANEDSPIFEIDLDKTKSLITNH